MQVLTETIGALRAVDWPRRVVLQNSTVVVFVLALVVLLVLLVDVLGSHLLRWLT